MKNRQAAEPSADRPYIPGYGVPKGKKGLLPWSHVQQRMSQAMHYWVCTVDPQGRPHSTPVDGIWLEDRLYFGGSPATRRHRNLQQNPAVCIHLESAMDVIIVHGEALELKDADDRLAIRLSEASKAKYGYSPGPEAYKAGPGVYVLAPSKVFGWTRFPKDATRWRFPKDES